MIRVVNRNKCRARKNTAHVVSVFVPRRVTDDGFVLCFFSNSRSPKPQLTISTLSRQSHWDVPESRVQLESRFPDRSEVATL